jgi:response regulator of citrate/malate metabolism
MLLVEDDKAGIIAENPKQGIAGYMAKPFGYKKFVELIQAITTHWALGSSPANEN